MITLVAPKRARSNASFKRSYRHQRPSPSAPRNIVYGECMQNAGVVVVHAYSELAETRYTVHGRLHCSCILRNRVQW